MIRFELLDHIPDGCFAVAENGSVVAWSSVLEDWTGIPRARVIGTDLYATFPLLAAPRYRSRIEQTLSLGAPAVLSALLTPPFFPRARDSARRRYEQVTITRMKKRGDGPHIALVTIRDVSDQYDRGAKFRQEAELRLAQARELEVAIVAAESATRAKSLFLASMSHELRTPMNGVLGMADILLSSDLTPWQRENLEVLQASASSLLTVLNDVLDFSKIEADKLELESIPVDPRAVVEECVVLVAELAHAKDVECTAIVAPEVPRRILGDPVRVRQVLMNLLSNAIKFTSSGEVVVTLDVKGDRLSCAVRDTGGGMSKETAARLFVPFTQAGASTSRLHGGTGLGLSICRRLMRLMDGDVEVTSELGQGSTFRFEWPMRRPEGTSEIAAHAGTRPRVAVCLAHPASSRALVAQLTSIGADAVACEPMALATMAVLGPITHVVVDPSSAGAVTSLGITAQLVLATRPSGSRGTPPAGFAALVALPCRAQSLEQVLALGTARPVVNEAPKLAMRILVAEDDRTNQLVARSMLTRLGCSVEIVGDGRAAVAATQDATYDLVLMDMQMPVMSGCEAAATLRERGYRGPILALTASVLAEEQSACLAAGMNEVLTKPLDRRALHDALSRWQLAPNHE